MAADYGLNRMMDPVRPFCSFCLPQGSALAKAAPRRRCEHNQRCARNSTTFLKDDTDELAPLGKLLSCIQSLFGFMHDSIRGCCAPSRGRPDYGRQKGA